MPINEENPELKKIRHYRGDWKDFANYWKSRGIDLNPYDKIEYEYPKKITKKDNSIPRQTFGIQLVRENRTFLKFDEFISLQSKNIE